ncbi:pyridoxal phosphate-dependent transferase [Mycena olivaceomarginata]|nr:pyridoxal phosphate-dependent transferase [Mycena olivaceomarginata]
MDSFITGGNTEASLFADYIVSGFDQNAQVHAPKETIGGAVEAAALRLLQQLLCIDEASFPGRILTTGATASNILGLSLGREFAVAEAGRRRSPPSISSVAQLGFVPACLQAGVRKFQVLTTLPHSSLYKAAYVVGLGKNAVVSLPLSAEEPWRRFAASREETIKIRALADNYGAWIHVDGAFGLQARVLLPSESHSSIVDGIHSIHLADSLTGDAHKLLNVPYDCGFFCKNLALQQAVFQNGASVIPDTAEIPSPHNLGMENSRRLRALPVYASLLTYGRVWHRTLLERQIEFARTIATFILGSEAYKLLPRNTDLKDVYMIVRFRARSAALNDRLVSQLNASRVMCVSGSRWGRGACG